MVGGVLKPRDYQVEAADAVEREWGLGRGATAVVMATGLGKTIVFAELIRRFRARTGRRSLVLAHRAELIEQGAQRVRDVAPELGVGIVKAGRNQTTAPVVVGSVDTLRGERRRAMLRDVGLVIVDECHHATAPSYRMIMDHFGVGRPGGALAAGFTATLTRGDGVALGDVWRSVAFRRDIVWGFRHGWLVRPFGKHVEVSDLDLSKVRKTAGDYRDGDLGEALERSMAPEAVAKAYLEHAQGRPGILFAPTVRAAQLFGEALTGVGLRVGHVNGLQAVSERSGTLADLAAGRLDVVTNCAVLTEGTDIPRVSCIVIARPTLSVGLFIQMSGRGLRLFPGKSDCLILDVVGATQRHALISPVDLYGEEPKVIDPDADVDAIELDDEPVEATVGAAPEMYVNGELVVTEVDLFHGSDSAWMTTDGGVWFLRAGERYIALLPSRTAAGRFDVIEMHATLHGTGRWVAQGIADQGYAMQWAEGAVRPGEELYANRKRPWRAKPPSEKQIFVARRLGIAIDERMRSGEVSNLIEIRKATNRIDPPLRGWYGGR
jgi:superfamily II DNA or RNA helicase